MKVLVISLPESAERRHSATGKLTALGLSFEFIDGINGNNSYEYAPYKQNFSELINFNLKW